MRANNAIILKTNLAVLALLAGGLLYVIYRPERLLMFRWFEALNMDGIVGQLRSLQDYITPVSWVLYYLPTGLWLLSYLLTVDVIWGDDKKYSSYKNVFLYAFSALAIISEILQIWNVIPGTFDILDICSYLLALLIFLTIKYFKL